MIASCPTPAQPLDSSSIWYIDLFNMLRSGHEYLVAKSKTNPNGPKIQIELMLIVKKFKT